MIEVDELQLWGGLECTVNRVREHWMDQLERCGHFDRTGDMELFHDLGLRTLRYGLHWERYCKAGTFDVFKKPLDEMRQLNMQPIAGLVHHGSGPAETDLLDPHFGDKLAVYARQLAEHYPWIQRYTPVNEPQTTARFSGLYQHWYPHHRSIPSYVRALVNQVKASALSMRAIRSVRSDALFIHTEDGGKTWSTEALAELCEEREHRRWLGVDLLCGRVDENHPMFEFLLSNGISQREILWFAENPCPPDVLGLNYYLTSDRFLDHQVWNYPDWLAGGDTGDEPLVDIEAVRLRAGGIAGAGTILTEAWDRYGIPVAITEAHLGGCEQDQLCWLNEVWNEAKAVRRHGVNCVAVTPWALLGSYDWCTLVTEQNGVYEPGIFDVRSGEPTPTRLAGLVKRLAAGEEVRIEGCGWWRRPDRFTFDPVEEHEMEPAF